MDTRRQRVLACDLLLWRAGFGKKSTFLGREICGVRCALRTVVAGRKILQLIWKRSGFHDGFLHFLGTAVDRAGLDRLNLEWGYQGGTNVEANGDPS